jgi:hypothetical protein
LYSFSVILTVDKQKGRIRYPGTNPVVFGWEKNQMNRTVGIILATADVH